MTSLARRLRGDGRRDTAPTLFLSQKDARGRLSLRQAEIRKAWEPPEAQDQRPAKQTFADYAEQWLAERRLKDRTREPYRKLLDQHLLKARFAELPLSSITADDVRARYAKMGTKTPTLRAHCYGPLRTIMNTAASDGKIRVNPCVIRGAGTAKRVRRIRPATLDELEIITSAMPEQYQLTILLASWCALRFGELTELRRMDIDLADEVIRVRRAVVRISEGFKETHVAQGRDRKIAALLSKLAENSGSAMGEPINYVVVCNCGGEAKAVAFIDDGRLLRISPCRGSNPSTAGL